MPAAIPIAAAAVGAIGAGVAGASGVGKNPYRATNVADTKHYDPSRFQYGGTPAGAEINATRYGDWARSAQGRTAWNANGTQANYTGANSWEAAQLQGRQGQYDAAGLMMGRARGEGTSIAQMQADRQMQQAQAAQASQQASARGAAGLALAQQNAANNTANAQSAISGQAQINAANERLAAEQAAFGAYSGMRGQDQGAQAQQAQQAQYQAGLDQSTNQFNAQLQANQRAQNDAMSLGMTGYENQVRSAQLQAGIAQQGMLAGQHTAAQGMNMGANQANAAREMEFFKGGMGAVQGAAQMGAASSDERAKQNVRDLGDVEDWGKDNPFRPPVSLSDAIAAKQREGQRDPVSIHRDTPADQRRVADAYFASLGQKADQQMAGMRHAMSQGPAVAVPRDEGELDGAPAPWLAEYMASQQPPQYAVSDERAKRAAYISGLQNGQAMGLAGDAAPIDPKAIGEPGKPSQYDREQGAAIQRAQTASVFDPATRKGVPQASVYTPSAAEMERAAAIKAATELDQVEHAAPPAARAGAPRVWVGNRPIASRMRPTTTSDERAKTGIRETPLADTARAMHGFAYEYKPDFAPPDQAPGEPNVGPMAQRMERDPIARTVVKEDPNGLKQLDITKLVKLLAAVTADNQRQDDAQSKQLATLSSRMGRRA